MIVYAILSQDKHMGYRYEFEEYGQDAEIFRESLLEILTILGKRGWIHSGSDEYLNMIFYKEI